MTKLPDRKSSWQAWKIWTKLTRHHYKKLDAMRSRLKTNWDWVVCFVCGVARAQCHPPAPVNPHEKLLEKNTLHPILVLKWWNCNGGRLFMFIHVFNTTIAAPVVYVSADVQIVVVATKIHRTANTLIPRVDQLILTLPTLFLFHCVQDCPKIEHDVIENTNLPFLQKTKTWTKLVLCKFVRTTCVLHLF